MSTATTLLLHPQKDATPRARVKTMLNGGVALRRIAVESGVKLVDLKSWLDGTNIEEVENRIAAWLQDLDEADAKRDELPWVQTAQTERIEAIFEQSRRVQTIGLIVGPPGSSKTTTTEHHMRRQYEAYLRRGGGPRTFYFAATNFTRTPPAVLFALAQAIENSNFGRTYLTARAYRSYQLAEAIADYLQPGDLIVVDEAQHLSVLGMEVLRAMHDERRCGLVYLGNEATFARITGRGRRAEFAQLDSRMGCRLRIAAPEENDIDVILESWNVKGREERRLLHQIGTGPGGLRQLANVVRQAKVAARGMKRPLDVQVIRAAAETLGFTE